MFYTAKGTMTSKEFIGVLVYFCPIQNECQAIPWLCNNMAMNKKKMNKTHFAGYLFGCGKQLKGRPGGPLPLLLLEAMR